MNCPFCNTALAYDDGASRYTCSSGCIVQWSLEEMYEALTERLEAAQVLVLDWQERNDNLATEVARLTSIVEARPGFVEQLHRDYTRVAENFEAERAINIALREQTERLRAQLEGVRIYLEGIDKGVARAMTRMLRWEE